MPAANAALDGCYTTAKEPGPSGRESCYVWPSFRVWNGRSLQGVFPQVVVWQNARHLKPICVFCGTGAN